jgi:hypothetical protein
MDMTDETPAATPEQKRRALLAFALVVLIALEVVIFATASKFANHFTAGATVALAFATVFLAMKTQDVVKANEREVAQGQELLAAALRQAASAEVSAKAAREQAEYTSKILLAGNKPLVTLDPNRIIQIDERDDEIRVQVSLLNVGSGVAVFDSKRRPPMLALNWNGEYVKYEVPNVMVLPKDTPVWVDFVIAKADFIRKGPPVAGVDGNLPPSASMNIWYTDAAETYEYRTAVNMEATDRSGRSKGIVATLKPSEVFFRENKLTEASTIDEAVVTRANEVHT